MKAIIKRELKAYFTSVIGWVFLAAFLFIFNLYFWVYNLNMAYAYISYALSGSAFVFLIIIPVLTMRSLAEERRIRTDQLLYTAPVSMPKIILGKFLAMALVFSIAIGVVCICPPVMSMFGEVPFGESYTAILGVWLFGLLAISIGLFLSAVTESQVIAAVIAFIVLFITYVEEGIAGFFPESAEGSLFAFMVLAALFCLWIGSMIKNPVVTGVLTVVLEAALVIAYFVDSTLLEGKIQDFLAIFDLSGHLNNFIYGILDLNGIIYYLSVVVLCLFFTVQSLQKRRWN